MVNNVASWLTDAKAYPLKVKEAPTYSPEPGEILVMNHAVAINPVDGSLQTKAWWPMNYPTILGQDVAGEIIAVGAQVTRFKIGDRVLGHAVGMATKRLQDNAFQNYTILQCNMASEIPERISYENAVVLPLGLSTASCGLFQADFLALELPSQNIRSIDQTLLVWGGASSVGSNAIQLGVAAGYEVISTASPKNFDYVKKLGAKEVFNYKSPRVVEEIVKALKGKTLAGAIDCIGFSATSLSAEVLAKSKGNKFVATVKGGFPTREGVTIKNVFGTSLKDNFVGKSIYEDFLPQALENGSFVPAPRPLIAGTGLENIQSAINLQTKGTSAEKVVVILGSDNTRQSLR